jgi:formate--tetrahydrofolate ligase
MPSNDEIARSVPLKPITEIADRLGLPAAACLPYGHYKAKIDLAFAETLWRRPPGKLILVTAMTPTQSGEGKTTVAIAVNDGLNRLRKRSVLCLREPSLGPCFGLKGGATGGGRSQVAPRDEINLHFTGDFHAIAAANNLLAAMVDHHLHRGGTPALDRERITWRRTIDMNDRALREITVAQGGPLNGTPRRDGFDIVPASETMAVFCLARDRADLEARLARIIVGHTAAGDPVHAADLRAHGAMSALLRDALSPNLVQSLEHNPVLVHGGPFANISHGCNSVIATRSALGLGDYVVTEAGFGADLGAEKFCNIKCRLAGLTPSVAVVVVTVASLKAHAGVAPEAAGREDVSAVRQGLSNLRRHLRIVQGFGLPCVVAINRHDADTEAELAAVRAGVKDAGAEAIVSTHWIDGGRGAEALAATVAALADAGGGGFKLLYPDDLPLIEKAELLATRIYGADGIELSEAVRRDFDRLQTGGHGQLPICMAKTPLSFSADPNLGGAPTGFTIPIRELRLAAGAGYVVALTGKVMTMPGLPDPPAACRIHVNVRGEIEGLH